MSQRVMAMLAAGALGLLGVVAVAVGPRSEPRPPPPEPLDYSPPRAYVCYRASGPIALDGKLDDPAWQAIPWTEEFVDIEGPHKPPPTWSTRAKMCWDRDALYIGADLKEPRVFATLNRHDSYIFREDHDFEVFIDPDGDNHLYAELEMNALNTTWDLLLVRPYRDHGEAIDAWEMAGLQTAVSVQGTINKHDDVDIGWSLEIRIPWSALGPIARVPMPPRAGDHWRINFSRVEWDMEFFEGKYRRVPDRPEHNWVWSPQGEINMHMPERWGYLQFADGPPGSAEFRPDPTGPAREYLNRVYRAQSAYHKKHGFYAESMAALGMPAFTHASFAGPIQPYFNRHEFSAQIPVRVSGMPDQTVRTRTDSRTWIVRPTDGGVRSP